MRWPILRTAAICGLLLVGSSVFGQQSVTVKGVTYVGAELIKEYPQSVYISHASGRIFLNKADLRSDDAKALGVSGPVPARIQRSLDKDFQEPQAGLSYISAANSIAIREKDAIAAAAAQRQLERQKMFEREQEAERRREAVARESAAASRSPITSSPASTTAAPSQAVTSVDGIQFVQGSMGQWEPVRSSQPAMVPADLPEEWGGRPKGSGRRAQAKQQEWDDQRAYQIASQAGPEAMQAYMERRDAARAQQELQNLRMQQNQMQGQIQQMEWQQQQQRSEMQRMEWERQTESLRSPW